jgi:hypothetical protein
MRTMHKGMGALLDKQGIKRLATDEAVIFINRARDRLKSYSYNGVISYVRFTGSDKRAIDLSAIDEIARAFNSDGTLDYNRALKKHLEKRLKVKSESSELDVL